MALQGSLKDFPIAVVFQLIAMERKSGRLSVQAGQDPIIIEFDTGKIVNASHGSEIDETRLKRLLVKNRYIVDEQWIEIKRECDLKLIPVWSVLKRYLKKDVMALIMNRYIEQVIFDLLSLKEGEYAFNSEAKVYLENKTILKQVKGEYLIMEGYRIIDEWEELVKSLLPMDTNISTSENLKELLSSTGYKTTDDENYILTLTNETISIEDIVCSSLLDRSKTGKAIAKLVSLGLLSIVTDRKKEEGLKTTYRWDWRGYAAIAAILILSISGFYINVNNHIAFYKEKVNWYKSNAAKEKNRVITRSLSYYYTMHGEMPSDINSLVDMGYIKKEETIDPWGDYFIYERFEDSFTLSYPSLSLR